MPHHIETTVEVPDGARIEMTAAGLASLVPSPAPPPPSS